jgi:hypothetical protein
MKTFKVAGFLVIIILILLVSRCRKDLKEQGRSRQSLESKAYVFFQDSIMLNHIYNENKLAKDEILLIPPDIDSLWLLKGMFYGYDIYVDKVCSNLSLPYYDSLDLPTIRLHIGDSAFNESIVLWEYFRSNKDNLETVNIEIPDTFKVDNIKDFLFRNQQNEILITTRKQIIGKNIKIVEMEIFKNRKDNVPRQFRLFLFFSMKDELIRWLFY